MKVNFTSLLLVFMGFGLGLDPRFYEHEVIRLMGASLAMGGFLYLYFFNYGFHMNFISVLLKRDPERDYHLVGNKYVLFFCILIGVAWAIYMFT